MHICVNVINNRLKILCVCIVDGDMKYITIMLNNKKIFYKTSGALFVNQCKLF